MAKLGKKLKENYSKIDRTKKYSALDALKLVVDLSTARFDESVDVAVVLGVDPKQSDQQVRGAVSLPHGLGKEVRVVVFAKGPKEIEAKEAGADHVGSEDLIEKIQSGWMDFDKVIATPDMMATISKVAKILGPRGLMPNPKVGTVTLNVAQTVQSEKKGKLAFRVEKAGIIHASIGRKSMGAEKLKDNLSTLISALAKAKPSTSKGVYIRSVALSSTMGPGLKIDISDVNTMI